MKIPLQEFEQHIDEKILNRGLSYFNSGAISEFTEIAIGEFEGVVAGSEQYTVNLRISNNIIVFHNCNCPYDLGPICKHMVAVIFHIQEEYIELNKPTIKQKKSKKQKTITQQVKGLLKQISPKELNEFVRETTKQDKNFRNYFFASFGHLSNEQSKLYYRKQIRSILKTASGRDGWISWSNMKYVVNTVQPILDNANIYLEKNNYKNALLISTVLLEEMTEALQYADDSNGDLGYFIDSALNLLVRITQEETSKEISKELFTYCISSFDKKIFQGWDWHLGMIEIACELVEEANQADIIIDYLDIVTEDYEKHRGQSIKLDLLRRFKSENEVEKYIENHISNSSIRTNEIERAFASKEFDKVILLSKDGIACDEIEKPGLVKNWYNWLLKVAQKQKDNSKIIEYSRWLFIDNFYPEQDYYQILKNTITDDNWDDFLEELIIELTPKQNWKYTEIVRGIYIKEKLWDRLFNMLAENLSLRNIEENEQYLSKDYSSELINFYYDRIARYVESNVGRKHYQTACRYLRRMKKLGGYNEMVDLVDELRTKFPNRRALIDELNRV